jgi:thiosulfate/3-mercaptopyruvate sulfurtransferase
MNRARTATPDPSSRTTPRQASTQADRPRHRFAAGFALACAAFLLASWALAATPRESLVITAPWLTQHLDDSDLVLLHVGDKAGYAAAHIPGARFVTQQDISVSDHSGKGLMLEMPPAEDLRHRLEALGISDRSHIVVYYGKDWVSPSTRVLFTLDYAGLGNRSALLDGGMDAWVRAGGAVTTVVPAPRTGTLAPLETRPIVVDAAYVRSHVGTPGVALVDGRSSSYYDGVEAGGDNDHPQRSGHIAGARSVPFTEITDDQLMLKSPAELAALFTKAGVKPSDAIIGYCHIGQQATAMLFAARTLGHDVFLYDGSFQDWSRHADYPVENPSKKGQP